MCIIDECTSYVQKPLGKKWKVCGKSWGLRESLVGSVYRDWLRGTKDFLSDVTISLGLPFTFMNHYTPLFDTWERAAYEYMAKQWKNGWADQMINLIRRWDWKVLARQDACFLFMILSIFPNVSHFRWNLGIWDVG